MVEAGREQVSPRRMWSAPSNYGHNCCKKIAAAIRELQQKAGKPKREFTPAPVDQELYDQISAEFREELTDALNTQKYPKLESYTTDSRPESPRRRRPARRTASRSRPSVRCPQRAHIPRRDVEGPAPSRRPRLRPDSADHDRSGRPAAHSRLRTVHPRRNPGAGDRDAGHQGRRAADRDA